MSTVPHTLEPVHFSPQTIYCGDCLEILSQFPANSVDLIYIDPPFNSNRNYEVFWGDTQEKRAFDDRYGDALAYCDYMRPRVEQLHRVLKSTGSFYYHCDWHASHYIKVMLDEIFGFQFFQNEIIWHYNTGGKGKKNFLRKHDTIFWYSKSRDYLFNRDDIAIPRKLGTAHLRHGVDEDGREYYEDFSPRKSGKQYRWYLDEGLTPMDVWTDIQALNPSASERLGYPTQKPLALLERIIKASSNPGDIVLDAFCGCGTALVASQQLGRRWLGIDISPTSCNVMGKRLEEVCAMRIAPPSMGAEEIAGSWNASAARRGLDGGKFDGGTGALARGKAGKMETVKRGADAGATAGGAGALPADPATGEGARATDSTRATGSGGTRGISYYAFSNLPRSAEQLRKLPGFEFENWAVLQLGEVLRHQGHRIFAQTNRSKVGDLGLDGRIYIAGSVSIPRTGGDLPLMEATGAGSGEKQKYLPIQVKNTDKVGRPEIDKFETALRRDMRTAGFFIGWEFSSDALKEVERVKKVDDPLYIIPVRVQTLIEESFDVELMVLRGM